MRADPLPIGREKYKVNISLHSRFGTVFKVEYGPLQVGEKSRVFFLATKGFMYFIDFIV